jgi:hypothetical protein
VRIAAKLPEVFSKPHRVHQIHSAGKRGDVSERRSSFGSFRRTTGQDFVEPLHDAGCGTRPFLVEPAGQVPDQRLCPQWKPRRALSIRTGFQRALINGGRTPTRRRRLKRGVFRSLVELHAAINRFIEANSQAPRPFIWTADPPTRPSLPSDAGTKCVRFCPVGHRASTFDSLRRSVGGSFHAGVLSRPTLRTRRARGGQSQSVEYQGLGVHGRAAPSAAEPVPDSGERETICGSSSSSLTPVIGFGCLVHTGFMYLCDFALGESGFVATGDATDS